MDDDWSLARERRSMLGTVAHLLLISMLLLTAALMLA